MPLNRSMLRVWPQVCEGEAYKAQHNPTCQAVRGADTSFSSFSYDIISYLNSSPFYCCILLLFDVFKTWGTNNESVAYLAIGCSVLNVVWVSEYFENRKLDREHGNFLDLPSGILSPKGIKWHNGSARLTPKLILIGNDFKKIRPLDWWKSVKPLLQPPGWRLPSHAQPLSHSVPKFFKRWIFGQTIAKDLFEQKKLQDLENVAWHWHDTLCTLAVHPSVNQKSKLIWTKIWRPANSQLFFRRWHLNLVNHPKVLADVWASQPGNGSREKFIVSAAIFSACQSFAKLQMTEAHNAPRGIQTQKPLSSENLASKVPKTFLQIKLYSLHAAMQCKTGKGKRNLVSWCFMGQKSEKKGGTQHT